jgi:vacuolar-type H+-ATPase subunit H
LGAEHQRASLVSAAEAEAQRKTSEITAEAQRRAQELLEEAEREAKRVVLDTAQERARLLSDLEHERSLLEDARAKLAAPTPIEAATQKAAELLAAAERQRDELMRESEVEAEHKAAEIIESARRQTQGLLEEAEVEAARIVATASQQRERLVEELANERSDFEETRARLSGFLTSALEEVDAAPGTGDGPANIRDLDEARAVRTTARADH